MILLSTNGHNFNRLVEQFQNIKGVKKSEEVKNGTFFLCEVYTAKKQWITFAIAIGCQHGTTFIVKNFKNIHYYSIYGDKKDISIFDILDKYKIEYKQSEKNKYEILGD